MFPLLLGGLLTACVDAVGTPTSANSGNVMMEAPSVGDRAAATVVSYPLVSIQAATKTLAVGKTGALMAKLSGASGTHWMGCCMKWSSSDTSVVKVTTGGWNTPAGDTGRLQARKAGTATITGRTESGTVGTVTITVTSSTSSTPAAQPSPATSSSSLTNCGAANIMAQKFSAGFGSLDVSLLGNSYIVTDATAPSGKSLQTNWATSSSDQGSSVNALFASRQVAYAQFAYKQDATFDDSGIKKMIRFRQAGYGDMVGTLVIQWNTFRWTWDYLDAYHTFQPNVGNAVPSQLRGGWHWYQIMNDISHSGALHVKLWIDGQLQIDTTDAVSNQGYNFGIVMVGGTFNAPGANATDWTDEIGVSSSCISEP